jgi:branched-chain amino acid transport system permease protein
MLRHPLRALRKPDVYVPTALFAALFLLIGLTQNAFYLNLYFMVFMFAGLSGAWNIIGGFGGQLSLGHSAFYGVGAYTSALLFVKYAIPPLIGLVASVSVALVLALIIGFPCFRLKGPFFTLATIAIAEALQLLAVYFRHVTEGSEGLSIPYAPSFLNLTFESKTRYALVGLIFMLVVLAVSRWIQRSKLGYQLIALRDEDQAAESLGISTSRAKILALLISGGLTAVGASIFAQYVLFLEPHSEFSLNVSVNLALISMVGGLGTVMGPAIGAFLLIPLQEFLRGWIGGAYQGLYFIIYGLTLLGVVMFMPYGIIAFFTHSYRRLLNRLPFLGGMASGVDDRPIRKATRLFELGDRSAPGRKTTETPVIEAQAISKRFGGVQALERISFSVRQDEIFGIIGPNGAGKSTLFNILSAVFPQDEGLVRFMGRDISGINKSHLVCRMGIGRTFQLVKPFENITVLENVMVGAFCKERSRVSALGLACEVLDLVGMAEKRDFPGHALTLADKKRLEMARALATRPDVFLLDEVMAGLTATEVNEAIELIKRIRDHHITVIVVEHVMHAIMTLSDRIMVVAEGRKVMEGIPQEVIKDERVIKAYLGDGYELAETG